MAAPREDIVEARHGQEAAGAGEVEFLLNQQVVVILL